MTWSVLASALGLLGLAGLLLGPVPRRLAAAQWPLRRPVAALLLWQGIGLSAGLAVIGAGVVYALGTTSSGRWIALLGSASVAGYLLTVTGLTAWRVVRQRRRHRTLLDLTGVAAPEWVLLDLTGVPAAEWGGVACRVLDHPVPMAYCLPGWRPRLVLTTAILARLSPAEVRAVVAHEQAHLSQRHHLVVLPFAAWYAALRVLPGARYAYAAVALLIEAVADDRARARAGTAPLAGALYRLGSCAPGDVTSGGDLQMDRSTLRRLQRLG